MVKDHSYSERGNLLPTHGLLFPTIIKGSFIRINRQTDLHIPQTFLHQSRSTGWNEKQLKGSTVRDRSDDPSRHERTLLFHASMASRLPVCTCSYSAMYNIRCSMRFTQCISISMLFLDRFWGVGGGGGQP